MHGKSDEEHELKLLLADGKISYEEFDRRYFRLIKVHLLQEVGRVVDE